MSTPSVLSTIVPPVRTNPPVEENVNPVVPDVVMFPFASIWNALFVPDVSVPLTSRFPLMFVLSWMLTSPDPESIFMNPVVELPIDRVCPLVVPNTPRPERVVAIFPELPEIEAVGVPELTLMNANLEEAVDTPPRRRSVVVFLAKIVPLATSNGELTSPDAHDPHVGVVPPSRH